MRSRPARNTVCAVLATLSAFAAAGCGTVKSPTEPLSGGTGGPGGAAFTFSRIQAEIFTPTCAKSGCHAANTASAGMVLDAGRAYAQIVSRPSTEQSNLHRIEP